MFIIVMIWLLCRHWGIHRLLKKFSAFYELTLIEKNKTTLKIQLQGSTCCVQCQPGTHGAQRRGSSSIGSKDGQGGLLEKLMTRSRAEGLRGVVQSKQQEYHLQRFCWKRQHSTFGGIRSKVVLYRCTTLPCPI